MRGLNSAMWTDFLFFAGARNLIHNFLFKAIANEFEGKQQLQKLLMESADCLGQQIFAAMFREASNYKQLLRYRKNESIIAKNSVNSLKALANPFIQSSQCFIPKGRKESDQVIISGSQRNVKSEVRLESREKKRPQSASVSKMLKQYRTNSQNQISNPYKKIHVARPKSVMQARLPIKTTQIEGESVVGEKHNRRYEQIKNYYEEKYGESKDRPKSGLNPQPMRESKKGRSLRRSFW